MAYDENRTQIFTDKLRLIFLKFGFKHESTKDSKHEKNIFILF
jgi:hypothetical protein